MSLWRRLFTGKQQEGTSMSGQYEKLTTKGQKLAVVETAESVEELDAMWAAWEALGWSRDGLLYAAILERKQELGAVLEQDQLAAIALAAKRRAAGAKLPPITGRVGPAPREG